MADQPKRAAARSAARLGAVQALYQMDIAHTDLSDVLAEFSSVRVGEGFEEGDSIEPDFNFLRDIVIGVVDHQRAVDPDINERLKEGWKLHRIDATLRALLRAGAYELKHRQDVPAKVTISEYVDVAKAFFEGDEPKVVNGVLDSLARHFERVEIN
ncbi:MAG: transcription antitermination factor NusB [Hyphomicrobiales bacterium]